MGAVFIIFGRKFVHSSISMICLEFINLNWYIALTWTFVTQHISKVLIEIFKILIYWLILFSFSTLKSASWSLINNTKMARIWTISVSAYISPYWKCADQTWGVFQNHQLNIKILCTYMFHLLEKIHLQTMKHSQLLNKNFKDDQQIWSMNVSEVKWCAIEMERLLQGV